MNHGKTVAEPTESTKAGHTFKEWQKEDGNPYSFSSLVTGDLTLKAVWEVDAPAGFSLELDFGVVTTASSKTYSTSSLLEVMKNAAG